MFYWLTKRVRAGTLKPVIYKFNTPYSLRYYILSVPFKMLVSLGSATQACADPQ